MRARLAVALLAALLGACAALPAAAGAHPLGNFSVNRLDVVRVSSDRVDVRYVLDQAEIPTFQQRGRRPSEVLAGVRAQVARGLKLEVDGRPVPLAAVSAGRIAFPAGQGGLRTTRVELALAARVREPRRVRLRDGTFAGRLGWRAIVVQPGTGTAVRSSVPVSDPTAGLRRYPVSLLDSPPDQRSASFAVTPGRGTVEAPGGERATSGAGRGAADGFTGLFADAAAGRGVLLVLLLAAFGWGALHALSPGHGKAMVAAYLVGTRGTSRDALALGLTVTVTHTIGVFALGLATLSLSAYVLPEDLYPWMSLLSGLLVLGVGAAVLRSRWRSHRRGAAEHDHGHDHAHGHAHAHGQGHHGHHHHHHPDGPVTRKSLIAMGVSAGLIPCPSALVVLLAAIAQHEVGLGLVLIVAFSAGLAATLTALGLLVVHAGRLSSRIRPSGRLVTALPAASALLIVGVGLVLTARALPTL